MEMTELLAENRSALGTGAARALRRRGMVPAIIYGAGKTPINIALEEKEITKCYRKSGFISTILSLNIEGTQHRVLPKAIDLHPVSDLVWHADFVYLDDKIQKMVVPIIFEGKERAIGVKRGGYFNVVKRALTLLCPAGNLPKNISIDVSNMYIGQSLKLTDLNLPAGCSIFGKPNNVIATIIGKGGKADAEETTATAATK